MERLVFYLAEDFLAETEQEQLLRLGGLGPAGLEVELLLAVDQGAGGAERAAHVVGLDLEAGQRMRLGFV